MEVHHSWFSGGGTPPGRKGIINTQPHISQEQEALSNNDKMSSITRMSPLDLLDLNLTNLDPLTENYDLGFYLNYLTKWPSLFSSVKDRDAGVVGYSMNSNRAVCSIQEVSD